jgi:hypothetical protein
MVREVFKESVRSRGDLAGVFEHDGETSYFYLVDLTATEGTKIRDAIPIATEPLALVDDEVEICWSPSQDRVGLFLAGVLWAVFNVIRNAKFGGRYRVGSVPDIPEGERFARGVPH